MIHFSTMRKSKFIKYWFPVALWMGFTFLMSTDTFSAQNTSRIIEPILKFLFPTISAHSLQLAHFVVRKLAHVTEYSILALLLFRAFRAGSTEPHSVRWVLSSLTIVALFASSDEFHQTFVPSRGPSVVDVGIDTFSGIISLTIAWLRHRHREGVNVRRGVDDMGPRGGD